MVWITTLKNNLATLLRMKLYAGRSLTTVPENALVLFPCSQATLHCGLAGIVAVKSANVQKASVDIDVLELKVKRIAERNFNRCSAQNLPLKGQYLSGNEALDRLFSDIKRLKHTRAFIDLLLDRERLDRIAGLSEKVSALIQEEEKALKANMGHLDTGLVEYMSTGLETLKDTHWCLTEEIIGNIEKTRDLIS